MNFFIGVFAGIGIVVTFVGLVILVFGGSVNLKIGSNEDLR